jgi:hypothetical protein
MTRVYGGLKDQDRIFTNLYGEGVRRQGSVVANVAVDFSQLGADSPVNSLLFSPLSAGLAYRCCHGSW